LKKDLVYLDGQKYQRVNGMDQVTEPSCAKSLEGREVVSTASRLMATLYLLQVLEIWTCEGKKGAMEEKRDL
jgi:hypothetical protein